MCGLVGYSSTTKHGFFKRDIDVLSHAMFLNTLRGSDSTGMFSVNNEGQADWVKEIGTPFSLYKAENWPVFETNLKKSGKLVVGHGRSATRGVINKENAHPFAASKEDEAKNSIVMVHNGTLEMSQTLPDFHKHSVDSDWLAHCIAKYGPEETFSKVNGAIACIWWDEETQTMYTFRNAERPLHMAIETAGGFHINSEPAPLAYLEKKFYIHFNKEGVFEFATNTLCIFPFGELDNIKNSSEIQTKEIKKVGRKFFGKGVNYDWDEYGYRGPNNREPYTPPTNRLFSYEDDMEEFRRGHILWIKWDPISNKRTHKSRKNNTEWETMISQSPHQPDMVGMELDGDKVKTSYKNVASNTEWEGSILLRKPKEQKVLVLPSPSSEVLKRTNFRKGQGCKFRTRIGGTEIRHKVLSTEANELAFEKYENNVDGKFFVGKTNVVIEVFEVTDNEIKVDGPEKRSFRKAVGLLLDGEKQSSVIDLIFFSQMSKETIDTLGIFTGTIADIKLCTPDQNAMTGAVVSMRLRDVQPVYEQSKRKVH